MMKTLTKIIVLALLVFSASCVYAELTAEKVQTRWFVEYVHAGDTFNNIIEKYYDHTIRANKSWDEWQTEQRGYNQVLFWNGRLLQPGDKILIVTKVRVDG